MKKIIFCGIIIFAGLLAPQITTAQGTLTYLSNLGTSTGSYVVGSDSWLAESFITGTNAGGYMLDSIQLSMADSSGTPSGFTVLLYSAIKHGGSEFSPGSSLDALDGSTDPETGGIFTYTPASSLTLSSDTACFIVLTAGTAVATGAYDWSSAHNYNSIDGWVAPAGVGTSDTYKSVDGSNWTRSFLDPQFAISATPIPEPSTLSLLGLGGLGFLWHRRKAKAV